MAAVDLLENQIEAARSWLESYLPVGFDWSSAKHWVAQHVDMMFDEFAVELLAKPIDRSVREDARSRLWVVWAFHWQQSVAGLPRGLAAGLSVAETLRRGLRPSANVQMGGDPLKDAVLAEGCRHGDMRAIEHFHRVFGDICSAELVRFGLGKSTLHEEFICDLRSEILTSNKLDDFHGYSSLRTWLRATVRNRLYDSFRHRRSQLAAEHQFATRQLDLGQPASLDIQVREEASEFTKRLSQALVEVPRREIVVLFLRYREGWPNRDIARQLRLSEGQTSRIHDQAIQHLRSLIGPLWLHDVEKEASSPLFIYSLRSIFNDIRDSLRRDFDPSPAPHSEASIMGKTAPRPKPVSRGPKPRPADSSNLHLRDKREYDASVMDATAERLPADPDGLEVLSLDNIETVVLSECAPHALFADLERKDLDSRPVAILLDARVSQASEINGWLQKFNELVCEQCERTECSTAIVEPHLVIFTTPDQERKPFAAWSHRPDIDWMSASTRDSGLAEIYRQSLRQNLAALLSLDPRAGLSPSPDPEAEDLENFMSSSQKESWRRRVQELGAPWGQDAQPSS